MADEKTIEQELCYALDTKRKSKEHRQDYLYRLVRAAQKLTDDEWNALRESPTQEWINKNLELLNAGRDKGKKDNEIDVVDFPDRPQEDEVTSTQTADDDAPARKRAAAKTDTKTKSDKKTEKKTAPEKEKTEKKSARTEKEPERKAAAKKDKDGTGRVAGSRFMIKELLIDDPTITTDELMTRLEKKGLTPTKLAASSLRSGMLQSMRLVLAQPMDKIKELKKALCG